MQSKMNIDALSEMSIYEKSGDIQKTNIIFISLSNLSYGQDVI